MASPASSYEEDDALTLEHVPYYENTPDYRDPFFDLPRGGQLPPDEDFYGNVNKQGKMMPMVNWSTATLIRGFNITPREYVEADNWVKQACIDLRIFELDDLSTTAAAKASWKLKRDMIAEWEWIQPLWKSDNGWWVMRALRGWVVMACNWIHSNDKQIFERDAEDEVVKQIKHPRQFYRSWDLRKLAGLKLPPPDDPVPLKHCHLRFTGQDSNGEKTEKIVPFTALMKLKHVGDEDLELDTASIAPLLDPSSEFYVCDSSTQEIKYEYLSGGGWERECTVENDEALLDGIMDIWKNDGCNIFDMKVVNKGDAVEGSQKSYEWRPSKKRVASEARGWQKRTKKRRSPRP